MKNCNKLNVAKDSFRRTDYLLYIVMKLLALKEITIDYNYLPILSS